MGQVQTRFEAYGQTLFDAMTALNEVCKHHWGGKVMVRQETTKSGDKGGSIVKHYFVWDGQQTQEIHHTLKNGIWRVWFEPVGWE